MTPITDIAQLDTTQRYNYSDYVMWQLKERVELIMGKIFRMSPAPQANHQMVSMAIAAPIHFFVKGKSCRVFAAPFDVRLPTKGKDYSETENVVQPDICVVCDASKIDARGCKGPPDLIVEIVSRASVSKDLHEKFNLYEASGVKEYWIVHPHDKTLCINVLDDDGVYRAGRLLTTGDVAHSTVLPGLAIDLTEVFQDLVKEPEADYGDEF